MVVVEGKGQRMKAHTCKPSCHNPCLLDESETNGGKMSVSVEYLLEIMKRVVESADSEGCTEDLTVVDRHAVIDAIVAYKAATGKALDTKV